MSYLIFLFINLKKKEYKLSEIKEKKIGSPWRRVNK